MAELVFSTDVFRPLGRPMPGVPMLLDGDMRLVEPACAWLLHIVLVRGRTRSPQTWRAYGEALYDWWQTLEANGWAWDRVSFHEVAAYRDRMLGGPIAVANRKHPRVGSQSSAARAHAHCTGSERPNPRSLQPGA